MNRTRLISVTSALMMVLAAGSASAQFEGLKNKLKKKTDEALKEVEKQLTDEKDEAEGSKEEGTSGDASPDAAPKSSPTSSPQGQADAAEPSQPQGTLDVAPARVVALGTVPADFKKETLLFSPNLDRVAWIGRVGSRQAVYVNGEAGPAGDQILGTPMFNADGSRIAYVLRRGDTQHLVIDGQMSEGFERIDLKSMQFSKSGKRFAAHAYGPEIEDGAPREFVCVDGEQIGPLRGIQALRFVGEEVAYIHAVRAEGSKNSVNHFVFGEHTFPVRSARYNYQSDLAEGEDRLNTAVAVMAVEGGLEQLWIGKPVGPVVKTIRAITIAPDGSNWSYVAEVPAAEGQSKQTKSVLVVGGTIVAEIAGSDPERAHTRVNVVFAEKGSHYAIVRHVESGMRVEYRDAIDPEYRTVGHLTLTEAGELSYWAEKDGYVYRVVNGQESDGIRGTTQLPQGRSLPLIASLDAPLIIQEVVQTTNEKGQSFETRYSRVALGDTLSGRFSGIGDLAISGDGSTFGSIVTSPQDKPKGWWLVAGAFAAQLTDSESKGFNGQVRLDQTGSHHVFIVQLGQSDPGPLDTRGSKAHLTQDTRYRGSWSYAVWRDGIWQADLYGGKPAGRFAAARGIAITPDTRHTIHWLGLGSPDTSGNFNTNLTWSLHFNGRALSGPQPLYEAPDIAVDDTGEPDTHISGTHARAAGSISPDGTLYRYVGNDNGVLTYVEYSIADLIAAAQ